MHGSAINIKQDIEKNMMLTIINDGVIQNNIIKMMIVMVIIEDLFSLER